MSARGHVVEWLTCAQVVRVLSARMPGIADDVVQMFEARGLLIPDTEPGADGYSFEHVRLLQMAIAELAPGRTPEQAVHRVIAQHALAVGSAAHSCPVAYLRPRLTRETWEASVALCREAMALDDAKPTATREIAEFYWRAIRRNPGLAEAWMGLANLRVRTGQIDEADAIYRRVAALLPDRPEALFNLGVLHLERGEAPSAMAYFQLALNRDETCALAHFTMGEAALMLGDWRDALASWKSYLQLAPGGPVADQARARIAAIEPRLAELEARAVASSA